MSDQTDTSEMLVTLTADIVAAHVSNNSVAISDLSHLINNVHAALSGLGTAPVTLTPGDRQHGDQPTLSLGVHRYPLACVSTCRCCW